MPTEEDQLREAVRKALTAFRDFHAKQIAEQGGAHHLVSHTQVESAMRVLWMEQR